jgi:putative SOS response-associated peptidase YedK
MCGRYELIDGKRVYSRFRVAQPMLPIADNADVRPTLQVVALQADRILTAMRWGLVPAWAKDPRIGSKMINARSEGIESKPSFKRPLRFQRCIIPASAFFEWQGKPGSPGAKVKYRIARKDNELLGFAGLYDTWRDPDNPLGGELTLTTCTIITTQPNDLVAPIHNRMPVILLPEDEDHWLDPDMTEPEEIVILLRPYPAALLEAKPASV